MSVLGRMVILGLSVVPLRVMLLVLLQTRWKRIITPRLPSTIEIDTRIPLVAVNSQVEAVPIKAIRYADYDVGTNL